MNLSDPEREAFALGMLFHAKTNDSVEQGVKLLDASGLKASDFTAPDLAELFTAAQTLIRKGKPAGTVEVAELVSPGNVLRKQALAETARKLRSLAVPNQQLLLSHALKLRRLSALRSARAFFERSLATIGPNTTESDLLAKVDEFAQTLRGASSPARTLESDLSRLMEQQEAIERGERRPMVQTGIGIVDRTLGGFRPTLTVIAGAAGKGKSALMATTVHNIAKRFHQEKRGEKVGLLILEDDTTAITGRVLSLLSGVPWGDIGARPVGRLAVEQMQCAANEMSPYWGSIVGCDPNDEQGISAERAVEIARDWIVNRGVRILFIDHLGEMRTEDAQRERNDLRIKSMLQHLRGIAIRHDVPVVVLHHVNREAQKEKRPQLWHLSESDYIGKMARLVLSVWSGPDPLHCMVSVLKNQRGGTGQTSGSLTFVLRRHLASSLLNNDTGTTLDVPDEEEHGRRK